MKKKLLYIAAIIICLSIITGGTLAYFTADDIAHNVITTNKVSAEIITQKLENGLPVEDSNARIKIMPATKVSKIVSVKSTEADAWIRLNYSFSVFDSNDEPVEISKEELEKAILIEKNNTNWQEHGGWYYYNTSLKDGEITEPLFKEIEFSGPDMGNEYQNCTVNLDIIVQAVQKANNGESIMEADGWPAE